MSDERSSNFSGRVKAFVKSEWFAPIICAFVVPLLSVTGVVIYVVFWMMRQGNP